MTNTRQPLSGREIRQSFLDFFAEKDHRIVESAPVVPLDDPTLLFTNAGMNQFKDLFLGTGTRDYKRAADTQKCIRVSGKHNDLEEVGVDTYHHTFFEMLGNWSFGDYFKREAIRWAFELIVTRFKLDPERLYASVFSGDESLGLPPDEEAEQLWLEESTLPPERVLRFGRKDNFWEMGEQGPCGPCSELHYDMGPEGCDRQGVPGHTCGVNGDCARYIEIWNLVFIQYNRIEDGSLKPLPARHVDTGLGLERLTAILQGKTSNYDTDLFMPLLSAVSDLCGHRYGDDPERDVAMRVIADHTRALCVAIADGALPGKQGRGYVLRRLLRRAARYGRQVLGIEGPFIHRLVPVVAKIFDGVFGEVATRRAHLSHIIEHEEKSFARTIDSGITHFEALARKLDEAGERTIPGDFAYRLYHQDGFPYDLIALMARERGFVIDDDGWAKAEAAHKEASRGAGSVARIDPGELEGLPETSFLGYWERGESEAEGTTAAGLRIVKLVGTEALVLDRTPFYAEAGGQVGDTGMIESAGFRFQVEDTVRVGDVAVHFGELLEGDPIALPDSVTAKVDLSRRRAIVANHTATHLLHWALKQVLGPHADQQGSLVEPDSLRFDFTHQQALTEEQSAEVERLVNARIALNTALVIKTEGLQEARARGVTALFGERYGDKVRVVEIGEFSRELCGGTHVRATGELNYFRISSEGAVQAGVRRIVARTGAAAVEEALAERALLRSVARDLRVTPPEAPRRIEQLLSSLKELKKRRPAASTDVAAERRALLDNAERVGEVHLVSARVEAADRKALAALADAVRGGDKLVAGALATVVEGKSAFLAFASPALLKNKALSAGEIVKAVAEARGLRGGGRPDFAQTGWKGEDGIDEALALARKLFAQALREMEGL